MPKSDDIEELFEFRIQFNHKGSSFINDRHFTSRDAPSAVEMFEFACRKDDLEVDIVLVERWNRWADRWEKIEDLIQDKADLVS